MPLAVIRWITNTKWEGLRSPSSAVSEEKWPLRLWGNESKSDFEDLCVWASCWETPHHSSSHYRGLKGGEKWMAAHTFQSHHHCQNVPKWEGLSEHQPVFIGGILQLISGIVCVVRCSSQSELWQPAWNSQLMPQEIPAIGHPYKVTFSIRTVIYRQIISTGSNTEHPACASHSGLNLLTYLLTHQCAVIISLPTHFTTPTTSFLPYLSLDYTLLHVLKWAVRQCQQISTRITKYMHFILQLKVHKSIPDRTKPGLQWLNSRISLQLLTFVLAYSCLTDLSRTFSSVSTELLYMQPIFTQQMIRMALAICLFHTSQSPCCLPNCAKKRGRDVYGPVLWEHNQTVNARQTNGVVPQTVTPKHTHGRVWSNTTTADCRQVWQYRKWPLSARSLKPFPCWSAHVQTVQALCVF